MTDRLKGVWVAFEDDIRTDDAEATINAIKQIRGVLAVEPSVRVTEDWFARERVRRELGTKLWEILYPSKEGK